MPINSTKNLYPGVNAHLNSFLQQEDGGWESFHAIYIAHLYETLDAILPSNYYVEAEKSMQIGALRFDMETTSRYRPDISIKQVTLSSGTSATSSILPTATFPLVEVQEDEEDTFTSLVIYELVEGKYPGEPVTWIELLSPANKPPSSYSAQYRLRRRQTLRSGLSLVEIDFLHQSRPVNPLIPSYIDRHDGAYPYMVLISSPIKDQVEFYGFGVDAVIPVISIPLAGDERIDVDLGAVYHQTAAHRNFRVVVDYEHDPVNFDRYTAEDQAKIRALLETIRKNASDERNAP